MRENADQNKSEYEHFLRSVGPYQKSMMEAFAKIINGYLGSLVKRSIIDV